MNNPKFSTPPAGSSTALSWFRRDLEQKADKAWVEAKLEVLARDVTSIKDKGEDTKSIAIRATEKVGVPHNCSQKETMDKIENTVDNWSHWWRGILVSFIGVVATLASGGAYQYFTFKETISDTKESITKVEATIKELDLSQKELKSVLIERYKSGDEKTNEYLKEIRNAVLKSSPDFQKRIKQ
jgi:hypothetical protein